MGNLAPVISSIPDFYILDIITFDNRLFCIAQSNSITELQKIFRLNLTEDAWEELVSFTSNAVVNKFFIHNNGLYIYSCEVDNAEIYKLNSTQDSVSLVIGGPYSGYWYSQIYSYGDHFYNGIYRSNIDESAWEEVYPGISSEIVANDVQGLISFNSYLYFYISNYTSSILYRYNGAMDDVVFVCDCPSIPFYAFSKPYGLYIFNNRLYLASSPKFFILKEIETEGFELLGDYSYSVKILKELDTNLYIIGWDIYRVQPDNSLLSLGINNYLIGSDVYNNKLYLTDGTQLAIYNPVSINDEKQFGISPFSVNFSGIITSDYPISSCEWDFGDGSPHSFEEEPVHTYNDPGFYTVTVTVITKIYSDTYVLTDYVEVTPNVHILIHNVEELQLIGSSEEWPLYASYELANDIDASGYDFVPIGSLATPFTGILNGGSTKFKISNLHINNALYECGIISYANKATFLNLNIENASINGDGAKVAILFVNGNLASVNNCSISGVLTGSSAGGFSANVTNCKFNHCNSDVTIYSNSEVGGLVGNSQDSIYNECYTNVHIECGSTGGGLLGASVSDSISNCHSRGSIVINRSNGAGNIGGLIGQLNYSPVNNCSSSCNIDSGSYVVPRIGGFAGISYTDLESSSFDISNCHATGNIQSNSEYVGGFIGECQSSIERCCATGNVSGINYVGGFLGRFIPLENDAAVINNYSSGNVSGIGAVGGFIGLTGTSYYYAVRIKYSYSSGLVTGSNSVGGFCGFSAYPYGGGISDCYWDMDTSGQPESRGGIGKSTPEMKTQETFTNWDFDTIWKIIEGETYSTFLIADFSADTVSGAKALTVTFTDQTTGWPDENAYIITRDWDFGDGSVHSTEMNPIHVYQTLGIYTVTLIESRNFIEVSRTKSNFIEVIEGIDFTVDFTADNLIGTNPHTVHFTNLTVIELVPENIEISYDWDFGDDSTHSSEKDPIHVYQTAGLYTVTLSVTINSVQKSEQKIEYITVIQSPIVDFVADKRLGYMQLTVPFTNSTIGSVDNWLWDFGDGHKSVERNPTHFYNRPGVYSVTLKAYNLLGEYIASKLNYIIVNSTVTYDIASDPDKGAYLWGSGVVIKRKYGMEIKVLNR